MKRPSVKDVDAYIANATKEIQSFLSDLRNVVLSAIPELEETIKWGMPVYTYHGSNLINFAAYKAHVRFGLAEVLTEEDHKTFKALGYKTGEKMVRLGYDQEVPTEEITALIKKQARDRGTGTVS